MKKYFLTNKNGKVRAIAEGKIEYDNSKLNLHNITVTQSDIDRINRGDEVFIKNSKLEFKSNPEVKEKERKNKIIEQIDKASNINEIKEIVKQLI